MNFLKIMSFCLAVCLAGCTSFFPVKPESYGSIKLRDVLEIETVDGDSYRIKVDAVTGDGIGGSGYYIYYEEIAKISRKETDPDETAGLITAVVLYLALGVYVIEEMFGL